MSFAGDEVQFGASANGDVGEWVFLGQGDFAGRGSVQASAGAIDVSGGGGVFLVAVDDGSVSGADG